MEEQIHTMLSCKIKLESCNSNLTEYKNIYDSIKSFLLKYCQHEIVEDYIDISYDGFIVVQFVVKFIGE
jgi:hypothetical protein